MPHIPRKEFQEFCYGDFYSYRIDFSVDDHNFFMVFTPVSVSNDYDSLEQRSQEFGLIIPSNSYDVKFDRVENFDNSSFYERPSDQFSNMNYQKMVRLGHGIRDILQLHIATTNAEMYFAVAESTRLGKFYNMLDKKHANDLQSEVIRIADEELHYAIKTSNYRN